jgi:leucyl aminopeptidase
MEFSVRTGAPASQKSACAIVPVFAGSQPGPVVLALDAASQTLIRHLLKDGDASTKPGKTLLVPAPSTAAAKRLLLVGCGQADAFDAKQLAAATSAAVGALRTTGIKEALSYLGYAGPADAVRRTARQTVISARSAIYRFDELKSQPEPAWKLARLALAFPQQSMAREARRGVAEGLAVAHGMDLARDLGNRPPNVCTPSHLAEAAKRLAAAHPRLKARIINEPEMKRLGMGALLSVTRGAVEPAKLIVLEYRGAGKAAPVALCGKGITFDTGGISLKPPPKMDEMKFDMCGAAAVLGAMAAIGELQPRLNVVALVPACENMPGGEATRPGDIVTTMSGQTVEILNTDAEGRLILCDAMTYAMRFKPRCVIDVATLTGACVIALGHPYTGLFSNDDALAAALLESGQRALDPAWRLPVGEEYGESLKSNFADFANSGAREGSASIAANFLSRFAENRPWAHLDIAGVAWNSNASKGSTGRPVPLLTDYLLSLVERK